MSVVAEKLVSLVVLKRNKNNYFHNWKQPNKPNTDNLNAARRIYCSKVYTTEITAAFLLSRRHLCQIVNNWCSG